MGNLFERPFLLDNSGALLSDWKWIIDNGTSIIRNAEADEETILVYEVPADKVLYLAYGYLGFQVNSAVTSGIGEFRVKGVATIQMLAPGVANVFMSDSMNPRMPIKLVAGEKVEVYSFVADFKAVACMFGYLLDA